MRWKAWDATFHRLTVEEKRFLGDLVDHWLAEKDFMLETVAKDEIFITTTEDLLKVSGSIFTDETLARALLQEFRHE